MLENILYVIVSFLATIIGSLTGIGGGIVLKSFVDTFSNDSVIVVSFYTTVVVFTMCIVSIYKQWQRGFKFNLKMLAGISSGSLIGGYLGDYILNSIVGNYEQQSVQLVQSIILFITLVFLIIYTRIGPEKKKVENPSTISTIFLGLFLGSISIFLGIGGGPLNVSLLVILYGFGMRDAAIYSLATVFFSQIAKIISIVYVGEYGQFNLLLVPILVFVAIMGGYIGTILNQRLSSRKIELLYILFMLALSLITLINIFRYTI
ncbi:sulfite exporter TauE/SafE family protein [Enterococcus casseliflavus]|uniref:sulfite exporter TauE/SafE family protein n=1 Tax=Enterococcus casseliflavus TaxID=37734 RepID=UPI00232B396C|nr:sulfite exporter TauE/SafE family protein [Enterococcus casseliflavus]MDB1696377.1 sulfite exporter TauE/SafE family protein [Enterococcus casseliflavus]MDB1699528.1 sulfite exporter TauE/SafE family protein [Enterococcus casseliflavus]MDB1701753.1 sulfite exporter TauE/SafE family protein [Enterococcus casseliflavus]MDB1706543.1 sulfite exporter TauE/SafE family protein [Enterococcus casseliflavus]